MSHDIQRIKIFVSRLFAKGQAQAASNGLHGEDVALRCVQRDNREQVVHIPAFLQLVDVQNNLDGIFRVLDGEKKPDVLLGFLAGLLRVYLDNFSLVLSIHEIIAVYQGADFLRMIRVLAGYKYDRFHIVEFIVDAVFPKDGLPVLVQCESVADFHLLNIVLAIPGDVGASHDDRNLEISFGCSACHVIGVDDV